jgi:hypothetical protein
MKFMAGAKINMGDILEVGPDGLLYPINSEPKKPEPPKLRMIREGDCCPTCWTVKEKRMKKQFGWLFIGLAFIGFISVVIAEYGAAAILPLAVIACFVSGAAILIGTEA